VIQSANERNAGNSPFFSAHFSPSRRGCGRCAIRCIELWRLEVLQRIIGRAALYAGAVALLDYARLSVDAVISTCLVAR